MSTNDPVTQEQLDAIQVRVDAIRARVDAMTVNDSWCNYPWPDPTDERIKELEKENAELRKRLTVDDAMVQRVARAMMEASPDFAGITDDERDWYIRDARIAVDIVFGTGEGS